jgi:hypothetical protein
MRTVGIRWLLHDWFGLRYIHERGSPRAKKETAEEKKKENQAQRVSTTGHATTS